MHDHNHIAAPDRSVLPVRRSTLEQLAAAMHNLSNSLGEVAKLTTDAASVCGTLYTGIAEMIAAHDANCGSLEEEQAIAAGIAQHPAMQQVRESMASLGNALGRDTEITRAVNAMPPTDNKERTVVHVDLGDTHPGLDTLKSTADRTAGSYLNFSGTTSFFCRVLSPSVAAAGKGMVSPDNVNYLIYENNLATIPAEALLGTSEQADWPTGFYTGGNGELQFMVHMGSFVIYQPNLTDPMTDPIIIAMPGDGLVPRRMLPGEVPPSVRGEMITQLHSSFGLRLFSPPVAAVQSAPVEQVAMPKPIIAGLRTAALTMHPTPAPSVASGFAKRPRQPGPVVHLDDPRLYVDEYAPGTFSK